MGVRNFKVIVTGLIQGVGFRPFVYRIATRHGLKGWVLNTNENVCIRVSGEETEIQGFLSALRNETPPAAMIESVHAEEIPDDNYPDFRILRSEDISDEITEVSPDIAVCDDCLDDIRPGKRRSGYAFVNCTNCGPRFTIISDLPYDRPKTTMRDFPMCLECGKEYEEILDRRFHAQPVACAECGPEYELYVKGKRIPCSQELIVETVAGIIDQGGIVLLKGLGGMHLACDALNEPAVMRLREIKNREGKPFAIMVRDLVTARQYAEISAEEAASLGSWRRPIVLLRTKPSTHLAAGLNSGLNRTGIMIPYMPFHHLFFEKLKTPAIVLTSGNFSDEPILIDNGKALEQFSEPVDAVVLHNRDIHNRADDSVVKFTGGKERVLRRSRGFVPSPVRMQLQTEGIIAFGAELTNSFCIGKGRKAFLSQYIGDLKGYETTLFYEETLERFMRLFRVTPSLLAVDMHPEYVSTKEAEQLSGIPVVRVQHHHAHIAACMAEHRLDEKVIGVAFDGTGYGDDGHTWGSEFLVCDLEGYKRFSHFAYLPMPGGDIAGEEPWRMAVSWLYSVLGPGLQGLDIPTLKENNPESIDILISMIERKINSPMTSGAGRYFDAVASLTGICQKATFQAQGPMTLESLVLENLNDRYPWSGFGEIRFDETLNGILSDLKARADVRIISTKFHNTIISAIFETVKAISRIEGIRKVVLSGGVFQNAYLLEKVENLLKGEDFEIFAHASIPANDGGIALGQLAVAAKKREEECV
jgi:hydrogenase maturation protein HypF